MQVNTYGPLSTLVAMQGLLAAITDNNNLGNFAFTRIAIKYVC